MDFFSTSLTLIQSRNNVVCPVLNGPCRECGHDMSVTVLPRSILGGGGGWVTGIFESDKLFISLPIGKTLLFSLPQNLFSVYKIGYQTIYLVFIWRLKRRAM